jgi:hypothetical protein
MLCEPPRLTAYFTRFAGVYAHKITVSTIERSSVQANNDIT